MSEREDIEVKMNKSCLRSEEVSRIVVSRICVTSWQIILDSWLKSDYIEPSTSMGVF